MSPITIEDRQVRATMVNELLLTIATCGRKFFWYGLDHSAFYVESSGRVMYQDARTKDAYVASTISTRRRGFSEGGTLRDLVGYLLRYIVHGTLLPGRVFGPWPDWLCDGDLWGYGKDMEKVRVQAATLGVMDRQLKIPLDK